MSITCAIVHKHNQERRRMDNTDTEDMPQAATMATYAEIAAELGVTRSAARKIEQRALRKLRKALKEQGLTLADYI